MADIEKALEYFKKNGAMRDPAFPKPSMEEVRDAEIKLGIEFPASYKSFLQSASNLTLKYEEFLWLGVNSRDLVEINLQERVMDGGLALPDFFVAFWVDGYGTRVCFDTRHPSTDGEFPIVEWEAYMMPDRDLDDVEAFEQDFPSWLIVTIVAESKRE